MILEKRIAISLLAYNNKQLILKEAGRMFVLFALLVVVAGISYIVKKYILRIQEPSLQEVWATLDQQVWFQVLLEDQELRALIEDHKDEGLLADPYYVNKTIEHKGTRDGFIDFIIRQKLK
jgi:hypothetical protein